MARGSLILSAILGGVGGGVEAGLAQRERERVAREREAESKRQQAELEMRQEKQITDLGYVPTAARTAAMEAGAPTAVSAALSSAMGAMQGGRPGAIAATPQQQQAGAAMQGMWNKPLDTRTVGGREYGMFKTPVQAATEAAEAQLKRDIQRSTAAAESAAKIRAEERKTDLQREETELQDMARNLKTAYPNMSDAEARIAAKTGRVPSKFEGISPAEQRRLELEGRRVALAEQEAAQGGKQDPIAMRTRAGMNEMLIADQGMRDFEQKFRAGEVKITVSQNVLRALATQFANEKTPIGEIIKSSSYKTLAETNPDLVEYMRNVDSFAEGESMITSRPSNFRTKMAQFLSGVSAGSPPEVVNRVQQRRRGLLDPMVKGYAGGDWDRALREALGEATGEEPPAASGRSAGTARPPLSSFKE